MSAPKPHHGSASGHPNAGISKCRQPHETHGRGIVFVDLPGGAAVGTALR